MSDYQERFARDVSLVTGFRVVTFGWNKVLEMEGLGKPKVESASIDDVDEEQPDGEHELGLRQDRTRQGDDLAASGVHSCPPKLSDPFGDELWEHHFASHRRVSPDRAGLRDPWDGTLVLRRDPGPRLSGGPWHHRDQFGSDAGGESSVGSLCGLCRPQSEVWLIWRRRSR